MVVAESIDMHCTTRELLARSRMSDIAERTAYRLLQDEARKERDIQRSKEEAMRAAKADAERRFGPPRARRR
jgi:hypothetical protein